MFPSFDVFSMTDDEPVWLSLVESLVQALEIAARLVQVRISFSRRRADIKARYEVAASGSLKPMNKAQSRGARIARLTPGDLPQINECEPSGSEGVH